MIFPADKFFLSFLLFFRREHKSENSQSSPKDHSFTFEVPQHKAISEDLVENFKDGWYPDPFEAKICNVKIVVDNVNRCPNKTTYFAVQSVLGEDQTPAGHVVIRLTESKSTACAEYKCPESDDHGIRVNVIPLTAGYFTKYHEVTQDFINEMSATVSNVFSFKPVFDLRKPSIGIIQSESAVFVDEKEERAKVCMRNRIKAGIRFNCST